MLVPATISMGIPASSNTCNTPTCANPLADPPLRTTATFGRSITGCTDCPAAEPTTQLTINAMESNFLIIVSIDRADGICSDHITKEPYAHFPGNNPSLTKITNL